MSLVIRLVCVSSLVLLGATVTHCARGDDLSQISWRTSRTLAWRTSRTLASDDAHQAAATDMEFVYAVSNRRIAKLDRATGDRVAVSEGDAEHLNSGFVWNGHVYCAHSNYPKTPERSEIMRLDPTSMRLSVFKEFGDRGGSLTWVLRYEDHWWGNFAYYGSENHRTSLVKFDDEWNELGVWTYPTDVIGKLGSHSLSGGIWRCNELWVTGHDDPVIFRLHVPKESSQLEYTGRVEVPFTGQGIANDPVTGGLVGIDRGKRLVVFANAPPKKAAALRLGVMSYNIHHGEGVDGKLDLQRIANVILQSQPDLVALQEVDRNVLRSGNVDQPAELARMTNMYVAFGGNIELQGGQYGNAILSRHRIISQSNTLLPNVNAGEQRGVLAVEIELPDGRERLEFLSTHLDHRADDQQRIASAKLINQQFGLPSTRPRLMAGDFNDGPQSQTLRELATKWRVTSTQPLPTIPVATPTQQIDFVLVSASEAWHVIDTKVIDEPVASDHRPLLAIVELESETSPAATPTTKSSE